VGRLRRGKYGINRKKGRNRSYVETFGTPLKEEYEILYGDLLSTGKTEEEAIEIIEKLASDEEAHKTEAPLESKIEIRIQFSVLDLEAYMDWSHKSDAYKKETLYNAGFDVYNYGMHYEERMHLNAMEERVYGPVVYSQERLDKEWLQKTDSQGRNYASDDARDFYKKANDPEYARDIARLSRTY